MSTETEILEMIKDLEKSKKELNITTGEMKSTLKQLKEISGKDTIKENVEYTKKLQDEIDELDRELDKIHNILKKKF